MIKNPERIIISRTDSIGDVVLTLPMIGILKEKYPTCDIIFLGKKYTKAVIETCENVDEFIDWDDIIKQPDSKQIAFFKDLNADAIIHVYPRREIAQLAKEAGIPLRIGTTGRLYHWWYCNECVKFSRKRSDLHEAQLNIKLLHPLGITKQYSLQELQNYYGISRVIELPEDLKAMLDKDKFNLILHPGSLGSAKEWGAENFTELIKILPEDKYKLFITGTNAEGDSLNSLIKQNPRLKDLTGKLRLDEFISFIKATDGLVAASTGPLHLSAALGKKAIGLFSPMRPIHPGRWAPLGKNASYLVNEEDCAACAKGNDCDCVKLIKPAKVREMLERK